MAAPTQPTNVLICGDVRGRLGRLYQRVKAANKTGGPFSCVFCVGEFFPTEGDEEAAGVDIAEYIAQRATAPLPTYFLGGVDAKGLQWLSAMSDTDLCPNVSYLGASGVQTMHGLRVAYLSGVEDCSLPEGQPVADAGALAPLVEAVSAAGEFAGVDLLLTSQWPQYIHAADSLAGTAAPKSMPTSPSGTVRDPCPPPARRPPTTHPPSAALPPAAAQRRAFVGQSTPGRAGGRRRRNHPPALPRGGGRGHRLDQGGLREWICTARLAFHRSRGGAVPPTASL